MATVSTAVAGLRAGPKGSCRGATPVARADYPPRRGGLPTVNFAELRVLTVMTPADFEGDAEPAEDGRSLTSRCSPGRVSGLRSSTSPFQAAGDTSACNLPATRRTMQHRECADDAPTAALLRPSSDRFGQLGKASPSMRENQTPVTAMRLEPSANRDGGNRDSFLGRRRTAPNTVGPRSCTRRRRRSLHL